MIMTEYVPFDFLDVKERDFIIKRVRDLENTLYDLGKEKTIKVNNNQLELNKLKRINILHDKINENRVE